MGLMIYQSINGDAPKYISNLLQLCENNNYNLRSTERKDLRMANIKINTNYMKASFKYNSISVWNNIPTRIRNINTISLFKKQFKQHLLIN